MSSMQRTDSGTMRRLCVLLCARGEKPADELVRALRKRDLNVIACDDPHEALARICNDARAGNKSILVFDGIDACTQQERLLGSMERFAPAAVCWNHLPGANPPIQPVVGPLAGAIDSAMDGDQSVSARQVQTEQDAESKTVKEQGDKQRAAPNLRLTPAPAPDLSEGSRSSSPARPINAKDVLDADELDALLASEHSPKKK